MKIQKNDYVEEQGTVLDPNERYEATITGFGEMEGQFGPRLVWQVEVVTDDGEAVEAAGFTSYSMASGKKTSNLIAWTEAVLGEIPDDGLDRDDMIGKPCRVDVDNYTKQNGITKNKVTKILPPKKGQKGRKIEEPKQERPDDVDLNEKDFEDIPF